MNLEIDGYAMWAIIAWAVAFTIVGLAAFT